MKTPFWLLALLLVFLAFALRMSKLAEQAFWWDEAWSAWVASEPFAQTTELTRSDVHPPLYQWALHVWLRLVGYSEFALRTLSVLFGVLAVAMAGTLARWLSGRWGVGALALALAGVSLIHVNWSQEVRMYALASLGATWAYLAYFRLDVRTPLSWLNFGVACLVACLSHYVGAFVPLSLGVLWLFSLRRLPRAYHLRFIAVMGVVGALTGAWVLYVFSTARPPRVPVAVEWDYILHLWYVILANGQSGEFHRYEQVALGLAGVLAIGTLAIGAWRWRVGMAMTLVLLFPPIFFAVLSTVIQIALTDRYYAVFAPLAGAMGALALWGWWRMAKPLAVVLAVAFFVMAGALVYEDWDARYYRDDYASMFGALHLLMKPDDHLAFISADRYAFVNYYLTRLNAPHPIPQTVRGVPVAVDLSATMPFIVGRRDALWLVYIERTLGDRDGARQAWLDAHYDTRAYQGVDYNGFAWLNKRGLDVPFPTSDAVLAPVVREVRPRDFARVGVPAGETATLWRDDVRLASVTPDRWTLWEVPFYRAYPNGTYAFEVRGVRYPFTLTHAQSAPQDIPRNADATWAGLRLLGYALPDGAPRPNSTYAVKLFWEAQAPIAQEYSVYLHLRGGWNDANGNPLWAQKDGAPADTPLTAWYVGLQAYDVRELKVNALPRGAYELVIGLYDPQTGARLPTNDGREEVVLQVLQVE
jgi:4-amino-4-deoxy-L-arabinose transferase-like glycosyltransferase